MVSERSSFLASLVCALLDSFRTAHTSPVVLALKYTHLYSQPCPFLASFRIAHIASVLLALKYTHFDSELWAIAISYCISYLVTLCDSVIDTFDYPDKCTHSVAV